MGTVSIRVHVKQWTDGRLFQQMLRMLEEYRDAIDEVAFFTGYTHPPLPLPTILEEAKRLRMVAIPAVRRLGIRAGVNHLATIGHLDENPEGSLNEPWQHLVDISGAVSPSCYCVADPRMREYTEQCYAALASAGPDFIWVDDDVRMEHHPAAIRYACFCPRCLDQFSEETGRTWTREGLQEAFNSGTRAERLAVRREWMRHNNAYIVRLLEWIRGAVDGVNPAIQLGLMTGETGYSTYLYPERAAAMAGARNVPVKWRPGGGFYTDDVPVGALEKAHSVGRQSAFVPAQVTDVQYEHENFPYQTMRKSGALFMGETTAAIGAGCTGVALNIINMHDDPRECVPYLNRVRGASSFLKRAGETFGRSACEGIHVAFTAERFAAEGLDGRWEDAGSWGEGFSRYEELAQIGLPMAYSSTGSVIRLITPQSCDDYSVEELRDMLSSAVLLDAPALTRLHELGFGSLTGFATAGRMDHNTIERLTEHPLNGIYAGRHRDCRPSFYPEPVYLLEAQAGAEVVSQVVDFGGKVYGTALGVFENELGGRVAVSGYFPWRMIQNTAKTVQLKAVCRWLSRGRLPAYVASYHKAAIWCRRDGAGRPSFLVLNASADAPEGIEVAVSGAAGAMVACYVDGSTETLHPDSDGAGYGVYRLGRVDPWQGVVLASP